MDLPPALHDALLFTVAFILINLAVDLLYVAIDPRVRLQRSGA